MRVDLLFSLKIIANSVVLFIIFLLFLSVHEHIVRSDIIFYDYNLMMCYFCLIVFILSFIIEYFHFFPMFTNYIGGFGGLLLSCFIFLLATYAYNFTFPVTLDRAYSMYILGTIYKHNGQITREELEETVINYFHKGTLLEKRIHEQIATGTIVLKKNGDIIQMTEKGKFIIKGSMLMAKFFNIDTKNISP